MNIQKFQEAYLETFKALATAEEEHKRIDKTRKKVKEKLKKAMEEHGILSINNDYLSISYTPEKTYLSINMNALEEDDPELYEHIEKTYSEKKQRASYVTFKVKNYEELKNA